MCEVGSEEKVVFTRRDDRLDRIEQKLDVLLARLPRSSPGQVRDPNGVEVPPNA